MIDEENELIVSIDLLRSDVLDTERNLVMIDHELTQAEEKLTKTKLLHQATLEALENLAQSRIVALAEFKALTKELERVNDLQLQNINTRSKLLGEKQKLTAELRKDKADLEDLEQKLSQFVRKEERKVLEFKR